MKRNEDSKSKKIFLIHTHSLSFQCIIIHMCILYHLFQLNLSVHMFSIFFLHVENLVLVVQFWPVSSFCTNLCFVIVKAFFLFLYLCFYCWDFWFSVRWSRYGVLWGKLTNKKKKKKVPREMRYKTAVFVALTAVVHMLLMKLQ